MLVFILALPLLARSQNKADSVSVTDTEVESINLEEPILIKDECMKEVLTHDSTNLSTPFRDALGFEPDDSSNPHNSMDTFYIQKAQLDDDSNQEIILFIPYERFGGNYVIKRIKNNWFLISIFTSMSHYNEPARPVIDKQNKLIRVVSEAWGSSIGGNSITYYKLINGKLYKVFEFYEHFYEAIFGKSFDFVRDNKAEIIFSDNGQKINVTYIFDFTARKFDKADKLSEVYILKDKTLSAQYQWDNTHYKYILTSNDPQEQIKTNYPFPPEFTDLYIDELKYIRRHGTKEQRKALKKFYSK